MSSPTLIERLSGDCSDYRRSFYELLEPTPLVGLAWRDKLSTVLLRTTQLFLDHQFISRAFEELRALSEDRTDKADHSIDEEMRVRRLLTQVLEDGHVWNGFEPENAFSQDMGLQSLADYNNTLGFHLPEVLGETLQLEKSAAVFLSTRSEQALWDIKIGLQHIGQHHIPFVIQALVWSTNETSWTD